MSAEGKKSSKAFTWKTEYKKSDKILTTYTDDKNQSILAVLRTFSNLQKTIYEKFYTEEITSKPTTTDFLRKISSRKKISNEDFNRC